MLCRICGLIQFQGGVRKKVLSQLLILLCNPFPVVSERESERPLPTSGPWNALLTVRCGPQIRKTTASHMYEMLLIYDDVAEPDVLESVMSVLSDTDWSVNIDRIILIRNELI